MSIATLKKKSQVLNSSISGTKGFSLNGGYRNQGWVGQSSVGRNINPLSRSSNDSNVVKLSVTNNNKSKRCCEDNTENKETVKTFPYNNQSRYYNDMSQSSNIARIKNQENYNEQVDNNLNENKVSVSKRLNGWKKIVPLSENEYLQKIKIINYDNCNLHC